MDASNPNGYSKQQERALGNVAAEVERVGGGQLTFDTFVVATQDEAGQPVRIYAARIAAGGDAAEVYRGASFVQPSQALRQALQHYQNAHKGETDQATGRGANTEAPHPIVAGNVGSLDDVPAASAGVPVVDE